MFIIVMAKIAATGSVESNLVAIGMSMGIGMSMETSGGIGMEMAKEDRFRES